MKPMMTGYSMIRPETQETISDWCSTTFPPGTTMVNGTEEEQESRFLSVLEEIIEVGNEMGISHEKILTVVPNMLDRCQNTEEPNHAKIEAEIADVDICLKYLATSLGINVQMATDTKMAMNRCRPQEYYDAKQAAKRAEGIR